MLMPGMPWLAEQDEWHRSDPYKDTESILRTAVSSVIEICEEEKGFGFGILLNASPKAVRQGTIIAAFRLSDRDKCIKAPIVQSRSRQDHLTAERLFAP